MAYAPVLDGVRAIAILMVLLGHFAGGHWFPGAFGVTLFFFISGYLITSILCAEIERSGSIDIRSFYVRRAKRLAPALLFMVAVVWAAYYFILHKNVPDSQITAALLYFMNYYQISGGYMALPIGTLWSLAIEEHFYLVFPLVLAIYFSTGRRLVAGIVGVCIAVLLWRCVLVWYGSTEYRTYMGTDTRIDSILFGCILALLRHSPNQRTGLKDWRLSIAALATLAATFLIRDGSFRETLRYTIQGLALIPLFSYILPGAAPNLFNRTFENKSLVWIGKLSYSLYLWHFPVLYFIADLGGQSRLAIVLESAIATVILAAMSYYLVETPFRKSRRMLVDLPNNAALTSIIENETIPGLIRPGIEIADI